MRSLVKVLVVSWMLVSVVSWAQKAPARSDSILVRLSFHSSKMVDFEDTGLRHICFSSTQSGRYLMRRDSAKGVVEGWQGTLSADELKQLEKFVNDPQVRRLTGSTGGLVLNSADTFIAEVQHRKGVQRFVVSDKDGGNPLPEPIIKIVEWLQQFEAKGAEPIDVDTPDICPGGALQPVRPVTAWLRDGTRNSCVSR